MSNRNIRRDWLALTIVCLLPTMMSTIYFIVLHDPHGPENVAARWAFTAGKIFQFTFPLAYVLWFDRDSLRFPILSRNGILPGVGFGLIVGIGMFVLYYLVVRHIPAVARDSPPKIHEYLVQFKATTPLSYLRMAAFISVPHSLMEEYYWRWFAFGRMRRHLPKGSAITLSSVAFMLHHIVILGVYFPGNFWLLALPFSICVAVGGGVWAWLYERSGSLLGPWLSHLMIDAAILGVGYVMMWDYW